MTGLAFQPTGAVIASSGSGSSRRLGRNASGGGNLLLVTSGDARLRLFDGYGLVCKAKGPTLGCVITITCVIMLQILISAHRQQHTAAALWMDAASSA